MTTKRKTFYKEFKQEAVRLLENDINKLAGVVTVGIFANHPADVLILGTPEGARTVLSK